MKKLFSVVLVILCVTAFAADDALAGRAKLGKVNGVARMNASGDIKGSVKLSNCVMEKGQFQLLVYVPGQSIVARPAFNCETKSFDFVLYNVPVPAGGQVKVTAELFNPEGDLDLVPAKPFFTKTSVMVGIAKHRVTVMIDPITIDCTP